MSDERDHEDDPIVFKVQDRMLELIVDICVIWAVFAVMIAGLTGLYIHWFG